MTNEKNPEVVFAPGCFDSFDGTQEELDELMVEIQRMFQTGEYKEHMIPLDELSDDEIQEIADHLPDDAPRTLQ